MSVKSAVKQTTNVNWSTVGSVVVGVALFGGLMYGISRLPNNAVTSPIKTGAAIANS